MGKALSVMKRTAINYNVESRAHRIISQDKPTVAPLHPANKKELERILRENPEIVEEQNRRDSSLDDRLKHVFVTSTDLDIKQDPIDGKPLPTDRSQVANFEFGHLEPQAGKVPKGKCTIRNAMQFISNYQSKPKEWTIEKIAAEYKMKDKLVADILLNFKMFQVDLPKDKKQLKAGSSLTAKKAQVESYGDIMERIRTKNQERIGNVRHIEQ